jgi:hypothetical protein
VFLFFSVARSAPTGQAERANQAEGNPAPTDTSADTAEKMPTDKLIDISPMALRMSSPFNAGYWLSAA